LRDWKEGLPGDWASKFGEVCGPVTASQAGMYVCDVEDTLWALEKGRTHRRWNG